LEGEGGGKTEDGGGKREDGRGKTEEGRRKREDGRGKRGDGRPKREVESTKTEDGRECTAVLNRSARNVIVGSGLSYDFIFLKILLHPTCRVGRHDRIIPPLCGFDLFLLCSIIMPTPRV